jgi:integrase
MARAGQMTARRFQMAKSGKLPPGMHPDGAGLYAQITERGASWIYRYRVDKKRIREMGLGSLDLYNLAEARALALDARRLRHQGVDPIEHRRSIRAQAKLDDAKAVTFRECADALLDAKRPGWRSPVHRRQWEMTLYEYACPVLGALPVQAIDTTLVMKIIEPLWKTRPETASRLRGRIEAVLDWAKARGYRTGDNGARWRGHLDKLLPARSRVQRVEHHPALPYSEIPAFMADLRRRDGVSARALEFTILTAARVGEVIGARWAEINLADATWTVPATRMKAGKEHRVPLSARTLVILQERRPADDADALVFPGGKPGKPLHNTALWEALQGMGRGVVTAHGFRSTFRDWAAERTNFPSEVAEIALAHAVGSKVEAAYRRGDMFEKRRRLMQAWSEFCTSAPVERGEVVALHRSA